MPVVYQDEIVPCALIFIKPEFQIKMEIWFSKISKKQDDHRIPKPFLLTLFNREKAHYLKINTFSKFIK